MTPPARRPAVPLPPVAPAWSRASPAARPPSVRPPPVRPPPVRPRLRPGGSELVRVLPLGRVRVRLGGGGGDGREADAELGLDLLLDLAGELGVVAEEVAGVLAALAELVAVVGEPGPRLLDEADVHTDIEQAPLLGDPLAVDDVELGRAERRGQLVLDYLGPGPVADHLGTIL